ncbi:MAG TPA: hypothetical protein PLH92_17210 [Mycobacterium sp.]|nr:hypothetical protein [Mycobacterium sp.]HQC78447.1 hypothetical protein [Mycobacterium sp.]
MNMPNRDITLAAFDEILRQLKLTDTGLDPHANTYGAAVIAAQLAADTMAYTADADTPEDLLIHRLAYLTGQLLTTAVVADDENIVRDWLLARAELAELRIGGQ